MGNSGAGSFSAGFIETLLPLLEEKRKQKRETDTATAKRQQEIQAATLKREQALADETSKREYESGKLNKTQQGEREKILFKHQLQQQDPLGSLLNNPMLGMMMDNNPAFADRILPLIEQRQQRQGQQQGQQSPSGANVLANIGAPIQQPVQGVGQVQQPGVEVQESFGPEVFDTPYGKYVAGDIDAKTGMPKSLKPYVPEKPTAAQEKEAGQDVRVQSEVQNLFFMMDRAFDEASEAFEGFGQTGPTGRVAAVQAWFAGGAGSLPAFTELARTVKASSRTFAKAAGEQRPTDLDVEDFTRAMVGPFKSFQENAEQMASVIRRQHFQGKDIGWARAYVDMYEEKRGVTVPFDFDDPDAVTFDFKEGTSSGSGFEIISVEDIDE